MTQPQPLPLPLPRARAQPQARPPPLARKQATEIHPRDRHVVHVIRADPGEIPRLRPTPAWGGQNGKRRAPTQQFHALFSPLATPCALQAAAGGRTSSPPSPPPRLLACPPPPLRPGGHLTDVRADEGVEERDRRIGRPRPPTEHVGAARAPRWAARVQLSRPGWPCEISAAGACESFSDTDGPNSVSLFGDGYEDVHRKEF